MIYQPISVNRRNFLASTAAPLTAPLVAPLVAPLSAQPRPASPNLVLILTDDQGWWDVPSNGNRIIETPNLDRLAHEGVQFSQFYACPVCAPTRASLMTGRHYLRTGVYNTRFGGDHLDPAELTLPQHLARHGYRTGLFGKWHLGQSGKHHPNRRGFHDALSFAQGHTERYFYPDQLTWNGKPLAARGYISDILTDAAIQFIEANRAQPFFTYLSFNAPHSPNYIDNARAEKYLKKNVPLNDAQIYGMIQRCDENIGRLLTRLDDLKLSDNTVVMFLSDNGGVSRHFKGGLRGAKASAYEGGVRVPFYARWPQRFAATAKVDSPAMVADIFPTFCELANLPQPTAKPIDGRSFAPQLRTGKGESAHEYFFHIWDRFRPSIQSNWSIRQGRYKLVKNELFDLDADPSESKNIAAEHPAIATALRQRFTAWLEEVTKGKTFLPPALDVGEEPTTEVPPSWGIWNGTHVTWPSPGSEPDGPPQPIAQSGPRQDINYTFAGYDWDSIDGWRKPGDHVDWNLNVLRPGTYTVEASYACAPTDAGGVLRLAAGPHTLDHKVQATAGHALFQRFTLGTLKLNAGPQTLRAELRSCPGTELMALNRLLLVRPKN